MNEKIKRKTMIYRMLTLLFISFTLIVSTYKIVKYYNYEKTKFNKIEAKLADLNDLTLQEALEHITMRNGTNEIAIRGNYFYPSLNTNPDIKFPIFDFYYKKDITTITFKIKGNDNREISYEWAIVPSEEKFKAKIVDITNNKAEYEILYRPEDIGLKRDYIFDFLDYDDDDTINQEYFEKHLNPKLKDKKKK